MAITTLRPRRPKLLSVEEWAQRPDGEQYELIDGVLRSRMVNQNYHEYAVGWVVTVLNNYLVSQGVRGRAFPSNVKYRIRARRGIMLDVSFVMGAHVDEIDPQAAYNTVGPDLAVEVLSPDQGEEYLEERLDDYWKLGTQEIWIVSPDTRTVTGYTREESEYALFATVREDEPFTSRLLAGLTFSIGLLWMR
jgi:Uma2 family endonuclease